MMDNYVDKHYVDKWFPQKFMDFMNFDADKKEKKDMKIAPKI